MIDSALPHDLERLFESLAAGACAVWTVRLTPGHCYVNLRGNPGDAEFVAAVNRTLGQVLPVEPNTVSDGTHRIYWIGPDEWLIATHRRQPGELIGALRGALTACHAAVTDQSGGMLRFVLSGHAIEELLAKGCTLDLHTSVFESGRCAQTGLAKASVLLARTRFAGHEAIELYARRSFGAYLVLWMAQAGRDAGIGFKMA